MNSNDINSIPVNAEDDMIKPKRDDLDEVIPGQYRRIALDPAAALGASGRDSRSCVRLRRHA